MKPLRPICTSLLLLVLGAAVPVDAQHDSRERDAKPSKQKQPREERQEPREQRHEPRPEPRSEQRHEPRPVPREQQHEPRPDRGREPRQESRPVPREQRHEPRPDPRLDPTREQRQEPRSRQDRGRTPQAQQDHRPPSREARRNQDKHRSVWQEHRAKNWQAEHRSWQDRGGYRGYRIPTTRYRSHFGPSYGFRLYRYPLIVVGGMPRFQYGGFWFSVMDPWPEYWSDNWYGDDEVYIEYSGDGYYLYNRRHATDRIAITVILN